MSIRRRHIAAAGVAAATLAAVSIVPARAQSKTESTWDLIKRTGKVRMGIFDYPPYFLRDKASGEWVGAMVEMAKDIAKELDVKLEMVEVGGFAESVLSLQSNKVDMNFGLQATPKRATAIDFAGPIYWIEWVTVNNPKFHGKVWADYNKPDVKVAVMQGTSDELLLRKMALDVYGQMGLIMLVGLVKNIAESDSRDYLDGLMKNVERQATRIANNHGADLTDSFVEYL